MLGKTKHIHFVGIGGIGMSGMAELLFNLGFTISGSDLNNSDRIEKLHSIGIDVTIGHKSKMVIDCDVVVYSSAVKKDNPEIIIAQKNNIPVIRRAEMLSELLKVKSNSIAISGTHGKTTTSSMLGSILIEAQLNPTLVIGGIVNEFGSNSMYGDGDIIVVEADEFDRTFLSLKPTFALINNLDLEHLDCYENLLDLQNAFLQFSNSVPFYGKVFINIDHTNTSDLLESIKRPYITYGFSKNSYIRANNPVYNKLQTTFDLYINNDLITNIKLNVPGKHNVMNALAAISVCKELDIDYNIIKNGLKKFSGVQRRFDIKYELKNGIKLIDDYAHHPVEVDSVIEALKSGWENRIIAIFQPHLFTRTQDFHFEFAKALYKSDIIIITDIFGAREKPISGISSQIIIDDLMKLNHKMTKFIPDKTKIANYIKQISKENDIIITMGAGNIWREIENINKILN